MMGKINIALECVVRRLAGVNTTFMIRWFRENTTGAVEDLGLGDPLFHQQDVTIVHWTILRIWTNCTHGVYIGIRFHTYTALQHPSTTTH